MAKSAKAATKVAENMEKRDAKLAENMTRRDENRTQEEIDANTADNAPIEEEEVREPEVKGKMNKNKALEVVNFYANRAVVGTPEILAEARKVLEGE